MKRKILFIITFILSMYNITQAAENDTICGILGKTYNPCTTTPCIPGLVFSAKTDSIEYVITINDSWQWVNDFLVIATDTIYLGNSIQIIGEITKNQDLNNNEYFEINVSSINLINTEITEPYYLHKIEVYQTDKNSIVINSLVSNINTISLFDTQGHSIFKKSGIYSSFFQTENFSFKGPVFVQIILDSGMIQTKKIILK